MENDLLANNDLEEMAAFFNARADGYDSFMLDDVGLNSFYKRVADCADMPISRLLDLGCGTGLELVGFFEKYPNMEVTGVDMSDEMLKKLHEKYPNKKIRLICGSYFDVDFEGMYDCVLSTLSLHHFSEDSKLSQYKRIYSSGVANRTPKRI
jgi:tRNA (cmo5U34)-methyltransferase